MLGGDLANLHSSSTGFDSHGCVAPPETSFSHANDQLAVRAFAIESRLLARTRVDGDDDGDDNNEDDDEDTATTTTAMTTHVSVPFAARLTYVLYALNDAIVQSVVSSGARSIR